MPKTRPTRRASQGVQEATRAARGRPTGVDVEPSTSTGGATPYGDVEADQGQEVGVLAALQQHLLIMEENQRQMRTELAALTAANAQRTANTSDGLAAQQMPPLQTNPLPPPNPAPLPFPTSPPFQHFNGTPAPFISAQQVRQIQGASAAQALASEITGERVDLFISDKMKQKIWAHEAINLALLLKEEKVSYRFEMSESDNGPSILVSEKEATASNIGKNQWISAWNIFSAIYLERYPGLVGGLATHFKYVMELMEVGADWKGYDLAFRKMIEGGMVSWGSMAVGIFAKHHLRRPTQQNNQTPNRQENANAKKKGNYVPPGWCRDFHSKGKCSRNSCPYNHTCHKCKTGNHPALKCTINKKDSEAKDTDQSFRGKKKN